MAPTPPPTGAWLDIEAGTATVFWGPAAEEVDAYIVYGEANSVLTHLVTTPGLQAAVPAGYSAYYVAAVVDDAESVLVQAVQDICVRSQPTPPFVHIDTNCGKARTHTALLPRILV